MSDQMEELSAALARFPGIGPRQARRFVYYLLTVPSADRAKLATLITNLANNVRQCKECYRFATTDADGRCNYCADSSRDDSLLMVVEKDQDLLAVERAGSYKGRYFVLGGVLTLSGKGVIHEKELLRRVENGLKAKTATGGSPGAQTALREIVLALSATSEGEHTDDRVQELLAPYRDRVRLSTLGRGLSTGSELEYSDAATLSGALQNRKET